MSWQGTPTAKRGHEALGTREYPRILFLTSSAFNKITGGGVTFSNLFAGWPKDRIATVHNDPVPVVNDVCDHYYILSNREIRDWGPFQRLREVALETNSPSGVEDGKRQSFSISVLRKVKEGVFGDAIPRRVTLTKELASWISSFRPELLYTILGSNPMMELAEKIRRHFDLPFLVHIMDDWPSTLYRGGMFSFVQRRRKERLLRHLLDRAAFRLSISDRMSSAYQVRYGYPFTAFQNTIDVDRWSPFSKTDFSIGPEVTLVYIGSVLRFAQLESLCDCCRAVTCLSQQGIQIKMRIHTPESLAGRYQERLITSSSIELRDAITDDRMLFSTLRDADVLLLPVNFDKTTVEYIRYSMPTKVPAYLTSGTPILVYGPSDVAQVQYAREAGWGQIVSEQGVEPLARGIRRLIEDEQLRERISRKARLAAQLNHDSRNVRTRFQATLREAAASKRAQTV